MLQMFSLGTGNCANVEEYMFRSVCSLHEASFAAVNLDAYTCASISVDLDMCILVQCTEI